MRLSRRERLFIKISSLREKCVWDSQTFQRRWGERNLESEVEIAEQGSGDCRQTPNDVLAQVQEPVLDDGPADMREYDFRLHRGASRDSCKPVASEGH